jgi:hypothetical protein
MEFSLVLCVLLLCCRLLQNCVSSSEQQSQALQDQVAEKEQQLEAVQTAHHKELAALQER